ncbi:FkbM family methyltransferase [Xylariaceae sp. FL1019]|nr:FkbM family methyltransferase [Xylariaceae sp. FL1019]
MAALVELPTTSCYAKSADEARFIYKEIYEDGCYDVPNLPEAPFIVDVGANIGLCSLYMMQKFPAAKILAFEPAPETYDILRQNLALHNAASVEAIPYGLASKASTAKLTYFPNLPGNSTLVPEEKQQLYEEAVKKHGREAADSRFGGAQELDIKLQRLSHFLQAHPEFTRIDLLKVDVEGAELEVLLGLDDAHWAMVQNVVLETWENSGSKEQLQNLLTSKGFKVNSEGAAWAPNQFYMITAHR